MQSIFSKLLALMLVLAMVMVPAFAEETPEATDEIIDEVIEGDELPEDADEKVDVDELMTNTELDDDGWWNILLLGSDARDAANLNGLSDTMIILSVNPDNGQAKLTSIMRDTWVNVYGKGYRKINAANVYGGPELAMRTVNEAFGMNISEYVLVGIETLVDMIDSLGGIELPEITQAEMGAINKQLSDDAYDFTMNATDTLTECGENIHVNGNQAVAYARIRKIDNDYVRTERQRTVLTAIANRLQTESLLTITGVVTELYGYVSTNLTLTQIMSLAMVGMSMDMNTVEQYRIPVDGTFSSGMYDDDWQIRPDFEKNTQLLHEFIYGTPAAE